MLHFILCFATCVYRPEKVRMGVDIVLHPGFSLSTSNSEQSRPPLRRQRSKMAKVMMVHLVWAIFFPVLKYLVYMYSYVYAYYMYFAGLGRYDV